LNVFEAKQRHLDACIRPYLDEAPTFECFPSRIDRALAPPLSALHPHQRTLLAHTDLTDITMTLMSISHLLYSMAIFLLVFPAFPRTQE
jgi:hypothetical protein